MAAVAITIADLTPFAPNIDTARAAFMIEDAMALAARHAPCIKDADFEYDEAAKAVIRRAILRWNESGDGGSTTVQQTGGPFGQMTTTDTKSTGGRLFWPSEINELADMCKANGADAGAFSVDTAPGVSGLHQPWCSVSFGAAYCSCGVDIAGYPIFEGA